MYAIVKDKCIEVTKENSLETIALIEDFIKELRDGNRRKI